MPILAVRRSHIVQLLAALGLLAGRAAVVNGCETL